MDITAASKMLPVTSRGRYGWARSAALVDVSLAAVELELADSDVEFCSWMLWILKRISERIKRWGGETYSSMLTSNDQGSAELTLSKVSD